MRKIYITKQIYCTKIYILYYDKNVCFSYQNVFYKPITYFLNYRIGYSTRMYICIFLNYSQIESLSPPQYFQLQSHMEVYYLPSGVLLSKFHRDPKQYSRYCTIYRPLFQVSYHQLHKCCFPQLPSIKQRSFHRFIGNTLGVFWKLFCIAIFQLMKNNCPLFQP